MANALGYVVTYDNGSGYFEWATGPCTTPDEAWDSSGLRGKTVAGGEVRLEKVTAPGVSTPC